MKTYYLMVKTHNKTGLKYLCQTSGPDPVNYRGSGKDWRPHVRKYGKDISTEILYGGPDRNEMIQLGRYYSQLWNVVNAMDDFGNKIWANRIPETGGGGSATQETLQKISAKLTGKKKPPRTEEHKQNLSKATIGIPKPRSKEHQDNWSKSSKENWAKNPERRKITASVGKANKGRKHTPEALEKKRVAMLEYWAKKKAQVV